MWQRMPKKILYVYFITHKELNKHLPKVKKCNVKDTVHPKLEHLWKY